MSTNTQANDVARDQLRAFVERIERTEEEIATLNADKSDIYKEARAVGFDVKVLRKVVAKRKLETHVREEQDAIFDMYWEALYGAPVQVHTRTRENIEEFRSDNGLNIQTKHEDIRTAPETAEEIRRPAALAGSGGDRSIPSPDAGGEKLDALHRNPGRSDDMSAYSNAKSGQATNTISEKVKGRARLANADGVEPPSSDRPADQPLTGGDHEVASIAELDRETVTSNTGEGAAKTALPAKSSIRPLCRNPGETCGGYGRKYCRACEMAATELEEVA